MLRKFALAAVLAVVSTASAKADLFSAVAIENEPIAGGPAIRPNVTLISGIGQSGAAFANNITRTATPQVGDSYRIAAAVQLAGGSQGGAAFISNFGTNKVVAVFIGTGTSVAPNVAGNSALRIDTGRIAFFASPAATAFQRGDPATWAQAVPAPFATFDLAPAQNLFGPGVPTAEGINQPANTTNRFESNGGLGSPINGFIPFLDVNDPFVLPQNPPFSPDLIQGLIAVVNETVVDPSNAPLDAGDIAELNALAALLGQPAFATSGTGNPTDFNPALGFATGDLTTNFGVDLYPAFQRIPQDTPGVPEPATMLVWGAVLVTGGVVARRRKTASAA